MFLTVGDLTVHLALDGPPGAPPLVLLHSLGTNLHVWDAQAAALSRTWRVIRPDLRGHGLTSATPGDYTIALLAQDLAGLLDALGIKTAHIGGISIGGMVAQQFAARHPERAATLILCDTAMAIPPPAAWRERAALVRAEGLGAIEEAVVARWVTPGFMAAPQTQGLRAMLRRTTVAGYAGCAMAIAQADLAAETKKLRQPALVLVGEQDQATPVAAAQALQQAIAGAALLVLENAAHIPLLEQPAAVTGAIAAFLQPDASDVHEQGLRVRRQVLGAAHVAQASEAASDFDQEFQRFITETAWGRVWSRPGLDRRTRSLLTLAITAALGREEEFSLHVRASKNTGASREEIAETLLHMAIYAGVPAANAAFRAAKAIFKAADSS